MSNITPKYPYPLRSTCTSVFKKSR